VVNPEQTPKGEEDIRGSTGIQTFPKGEGAKTENNYIKRSLLKKK